MSAAPPAGTRLGFAAGYNDKDNDTASSGYLRWLGKDPWASDAVNYWGDLVLSAAQVSPGFAINTPAAGARWVRATTRTITWTSGGGVTGVKIDYSLDNGQTWTNAEPYTANDGSYDWLVPDTLSAACKLRMSDAADGDPFTESAVFSIVAPYVTVTSPAGGETWAVGSSQAIRWTWDGTVGPVAIDLSTDNALTWSPIIASTPNSGLYQWTVPNMVSSRCRIRVREAADNVPADTNNAAFTIVPPSITVVFPNGGEDLAADSVVTVLWQSFGLSGNVKIDISTDNGASWNTLAASTANDGTEPCRMPVAVSTTCKVRVSDAADGLPADESNAAFRLSAAYLTVGMPYGGELWLVGSSQTVTWRTRGDVPYVKIEFSSNNGGAWTVLLASTPNDGSQAIVVPASPSQTCLVRVSDAVDGVPSDVSNAVFAVVAVGMQLSAPNGGEMWRPGTFHNITWTTVGSVPQVKLEYSTNRGTLWKTIVASLPNGGSYNWTVPNDISPTCLVRVSDAADGVPFDVSDSVFAIDVVSAVLAAHMPLTTGLLAVGPNPARGSLSIGFALATATNVSAYVHSVDGRLVRAFGNSTRPAGCYALLWDCSTDDGQRVQAGTYVVTVKLGNQVQRRMITVAR
jgi:hypothetical protein